MIIHYDAMRSPHLMFQILLDIHVEISKDGKKVTLLQVEKQYQDWIIQMHEHYDEEVDCGEDQPTFVLSPSHKKELGVSSDGID